MRTRVIQQGAVLFTLLFFLPIIGWLSSISWQGIQLQLDTTERHREQQNLITQAQQALLHAEGILENEYYLSFNKRCRSGRCHNLTKPDESNFLPLTDTSEPPLSQGYLLEKIQHQNLMNKPENTLYKIHILVSDTNTRQKIHLSALYNIRLGAAIRQSWLLEKRI